MTVLLVNPPKNGSPPRIDGLKLAARPPCGGTDNLSIKNDESPLLGTVICSTRAERNGTTSLFAALEVATGKVHGQCFERHTHEEFIAFLNSLDKRYPRREIHLICDNYGTHKHPSVMAWLGAHPRSIRQRQDRELVARVTSPPGS